MDPLLDTRERLRAIIGQAEAESQRQNPPGAVAEIHLVVYGSVTPEDTHLCFEELRPAAVPALKDARLVVHMGGERHICWNCCGLRFEQSNGECPNCGEMGTPLPDTIAFGLRKVVYAAAVNQVSIR